MDAFELASRMETSEEFANASFEDKLQGRVNALSLIRNDPRYYMQDLTAQEEFDKQFMTHEMKGLRMDELDLENDEDRRAKRFLEQAQSAYETGITDANFFDGVVETGSQFLTGKLAAAAVDIFTEDDTTDYLYGDKSDDYKKYRDFVFDTLDPEGRKDFIAGKVTGGITGFAADAFVTSKLYGAVGGPWPPD